MSYLLLIDNSDGTRLADAAHKTLKEFLPKLLVIEERNWNSENFLTNLRKAFVHKMKEIEDEENEVVIPEKQIGRSFVFGGAKAFVNTFMERILSKEEKIEDLAKLTLTHLQGVLSEKIAESEQEIILGLLKKNIAKEIAIIRREKSLKELEERREAKCQH